MRILLHLGVRTEEDRFGFVQEHDAVRQLFREPHVVRDHNAGQVQLNLQPLDQVAQQLRHQGIDHRGRFVVQDAFRSRRQCPRNRHRPLHPRRQIRRQQIAHLLHTHHLQQPVDDLENLLLAQFPRLAQRERDIFSHGQRIEERTVLKHHGDFLADLFQLFFIVVGDVLPSDDHSPRVRLEKSHDVMQGNRFAHATASENADSLCRKHVEVDMLQHDVVPKCLVDIAKLNVWRRFGLVRHEGSKDSGLPAFESCLLTLSNLGEAFAKRVLARRMPQSAYIRAP